MKFIKEYRVIIIIAIMGISIFTVFMIKHINRERNYVHLTSNGDVEEQTLPLKMYEFVSSVCSACDQMEDIYKEAKEKYGDKMNFEQVNVERNYNLSNKYNVNVVPTFVIVDMDGNMKKRMTGVIDKEEFFKSIESVINEYDGNI